MVEEEKKGHDTKGAGGGDENEDEPMPGLRFKPKDKELVEFYLLPRLQGRQMVPNDKIIEANVYQFHPGKLIDGTYIRSNYPIVFFVCSFRWSSVS
ncbi:hypothetical protein ABZP36_003835 [Zizania latifolia]